MNELSVQIEKKLEKRMDNETKQKAEMNLKNERLNREKPKLASYIVKHTSEEKKIKKDIKMSEKEKESLSNKQSYIIEIALEQWMRSDYAV